MRRRRRPGPAPPGTRAAPSPRGPRRSARTAASLSPWLDASADQAELGQRGDPVVEADLLADQTVLDLEDGDAAEAHRLARAGRQAAHRHVLERAAGLGAAPDPLADDGAALGDQVPGALQAGVGGRGPELGRGRPPGAAAAPRS